MRLNFYFDFPYSFTEKEVNDVNVAYEPHDVMMQVTMCELYRKFKRSYPEIEFTPINVRPLDKPCCCTKYNFAVPIIENPDNGRYFIISYCDKNYQISRYYGWDLDNCVGLFPAAGLQLNDVSFKEAKLDIKYTPSTSHTWFKSVHDRIEELNKKERVTTIPKKPFFRGQGIDNFRRWVYENDNRFDVQPVPIRGLDFIEELAPNSINIDFNGNAEISCRTLDIMGLGSALIRPKLLIQFHNPLIPDYHYAEVKCDNQADYKQLADAYIDRFEDLKKDPEYVTFLSQNGRKWYQENCTIESYTNVQLQIIDLNKLFI